MKLDEVVEILNVSFEVLYMGFLTILWPEILKAVHWQSGLVTHINATSDLCFDMALDGEIFQVLWGCSGLWQEEGSWAV